MVEKLRIYDVQDSAFLSLQKEFNNLKNKPTINSQFLEHAAKGNYLSNNSTANMSFGMELWDDYLQDIGRRHSGTLCIYDNKHEVENLMKQNGPKKMEHRLRQYLKRRIKFAQKGCTKPI